MSYISNLTQLSQINLRFVWAMSEVTTVATQSGIRKRMYQPTRGLRMAGLKRDFVRKNVLVTRGAEIHQDELTAKILHRSYEGSFAR